MELIMDQQSIKNFLKKVERKFIQKVEYNDLDNLVQEIWPEQKDWEFVAISESNNYSQKSYNITKTEIKDLSIKDERNFMFNPYHERDVIVALTVRGYFQPGEIIINVYW